MMTSHHPRIGQMVRVHRCRICRFSILDQFLFEIVGNDDLHSRPPLQHDHNDRPSAPFDLECSRPDHRATRAGYAAVVIVITERFAVITPLRHPIELSGTRHGSHEQPPWRSVGQAVVSNRCDTPVATYRYLEVSVMETDRGCDTLPVDHTDITSQQHHQRPHRRMWS